MSADTAVSIKERIDRDRLSALQLYSLDRLDSIVPGRWPVLDEALLQSFPDGYRHLAYLQAHLGYPVKKDMPDLTGAATDALYARRCAWPEGRTGHPKGWEGGARPAPAGERHPVMLDLKSSGLTRRASPACASLAG